MGYVLVQKMYGNHFYDTTIAFLMFLRMYANKLTFKHGHTTIQSDFKAAQSDFLKFLEKLLMKRGFATEIV